MLSNVFDRVAEKCYEAGLPSKKFGRSAAIWSMYLCLMSFPDAFAFINAKAHPIVAFIIFAWTLYIIVSIVINTEVCNRLEEIEKVTKEMEDNKEEFVIKANSADDKDGENG
jgi:hypothetical protein